MSKTMQREAEMAKICSGTGVDAPQPGAILQDCPTCHTAQITDSDGSATWFVPHQAAAEEAAKVAAKKNMVWKCDSAELANALGSTVKDLVGENTVQVDGTMVVFYDEIGINTETRLKLDSLSGGVLQVNAAKLPDGAEKGRPSGLQVGDVLHFDARTGVNIKYLDDEERQRGPVATGSHTVSDIQVKNGSSYGQTGRGSVSYIVTLDNGERVELSSQTGLVIERQASKIAALNAASVSAYLRRVGFQPQGTSERGKREGLIVSGGNTGTVRLSIDFDLSSEGLRYTESVEEALKEGGYTFTRSDADAANGLYGITVTDGTTAQKVAHDSGDGETIFHCPFCGSGQVIGRSDGTAICDFCTTAFTVQVQPERSSQPQTINGVPAQMPGMPHGGDNASNPAQQAAPNEEGGIADTNPFDSDKQKPEEQKPVEEDKPKGNQPPWLKNSSVNYYLTSEGVALNEDAYIRHLAIKFAGEERMSVIASVRDENERKMNDGDH